MSRDALVVGINVYDQLPNLKSPSEDAEAIAQLLERYGDFRVRRLPAVKDTVNNTVRVGQTTSVALEQLENALIQLFNPEGRSVLDTALLFFSGHGLRKKDSLTGEQEGFLAVSDTNQQTGNWGLSLQRLRRLFEESPVRQQIIWLDCCYSGEVLNFDEANPGYRGKARDRCFIAASREYEVAYEEVVGSHGVLTGALVQGLDPTRYPRGEISNYALIDSINRLLKGAIQCPVYANFGGEIILTRSRAGAEVSTPVVSGVCPYKGLAYFDYTGDDPKYFFGRTALTDQLIEKVRTGNFLAVLGASGSGKSSVVRAGLLYQLQQGQRLSGSEQWPLRIFRPGEHPFYNLASTFLDSKLPDVERAIQLMKTAEALQNNGIDELHKLVAELADEGRVVLVVDQFEEVFTLCQDDTERQQFFECLLGALELTSNKLCLILVIRADFFGKCAEQEYAGLAEKMQENLVTVIPMTPAELKQAITEPTSQVGLEIERELVAQMIDEVRDAPGSLPLLQYTLTELWRQRTTERLTLADYIHLGGVKGTLAKRADEEYDQLAPEEQSIARRIFLELTQLGEGTEDTRRQVRIQQLTTAQYPESLVNHVIQKLSDAKLLVTSELITKGEAAEHVAVVDVAHEALIRHWPRLRTWIDENRDVIRFHRRLDSAAQHWENNGRPPGLLWRSPDLDLLTQFYQDHEYEMTPLQVEFFQKGVETKKQEEAGKEAMRRREKEQRDHALRTQSLFLADLARQENEKQNYTNAILLALEGLPKSISAITERPYIPEAEFQLYEAVTNLRELKVLAGHKGWVHYAEFSPENTRIVTASRDGTARIWDAISGKILEVLNGHTNWVEHAAFSPDGTKIVTVSRDCEARVWDARNGKPLLVLTGHTGNIVHAVFSPDGTRVVTASRDSTARIWDAISGNVLEVLNGHTSWVEHVAFSLDGTKIVTVSRDCEARVWDARNGKPLLVLIGHTGNIVHAVFSPDSEQILTASWDGTARIWDAKNGKPLSILTGHMGKVACAIFSPDGARVVTASTDDHTVRVWDTVSSKALTVLNDHMDEVVHVAFSPDGALLATSSADHTVRVWDVNSDEAPAILTGHKWVVTQAAFSPNGTKIVTASYDGTARMWKTSSGNVLAILNGHKDRVNHAVFNSDGTKIVTASDDGTARVWKTSSGNVLAILNGHKDRVNHAVFSSDGTQVVTASWDMTARVWDTQSGKELQVLTGHTGKVVRAVFSPNDEQIVTSSWDSSARIWDAKNGKPLSILTGHRGKVVCAVFSPDGTRVVTASTDHTLRVWETVSGKVMAVLAGHTDWVYHVTFSPNGERLVSASWDMTARVWDTESGRELAILTGHEGLVWHAAFSPDGAQMVTASLDMTARVWETISSKPLMVLSGHKGYVYHATFSPDGARLVTSSDDGTARVWDMASGKTLAILTGHTKEIWYTAFSPDGTCLVTASNDGTARVWRMFRNTQDLIDYANQIVPRRLTREERIKYFLDVE